MVELNVAATQDERPLSTGIERRNARHCLPGGLSKEVLEGLCRCGSLEACRENSDKTRQAE
jgi:hypothetical protein